MSFMMMARRAGGAGATTANPDYMLPSSAKLTTGKTLQARAVYLGTDIWPVDATGVTWSTSDAGVATVNSSGLITPVALGSCTITAAKGAASVTMAFTVESSVTVAYILMDPLVQTIPQNGLGACFGRPYDVDGVLLAGQSHTWSYSNGSLITASGLRGVAASSNNSGRKMQATTTEGTTTVTATNSGVSATMTLVVSNALAPSAGTTTPNLPAGWTTIRDESLDSVTDKTNYNFENAPDGFGTLSVESDVTAPKSPNNVMRDTMTASKSVSGVNARVSVSLAGATETLYYVHWYNKSANWPIENTGTKQGFLQNTVVSLNHYWGYDSDATGNEQFLFGFQYPSSGEPSRAIFAPYCAKPYEQWRKTEIEVTANTLGNRNGRLRVWIDGVRILDVSDVFWSLDATSPRGFNNVVFGGTFNQATTPPLPASFYEQFDHLLIATP